MPSNKWTREELILAFNLYCKIPFGTIHIHNPQIIDLAKILGRTPSAVSWKLANLASLDPSLKKRNIAGAPHGSKMDAEVWNEFNGDWDKLAFESEKLLAQKVGKQVEEISEVELFDLPKAGKERDAVVKIRVNQSFFRKTVLAAYSFQCCITGLEITELLNASHIIPWSKDEENRVNPRNGLCLNAIHDRAFDRGLMTITPELTVKVSQSVKKGNASNAVKDFLLRYDGLEINKPTRFLPDLKFLKYHNKNVFRAWFMSNIRFNYLYRDGANYKSWGEVVFSNPDQLTLSEIESKLIDAFLPDKLFIAHQIAIPEKFLFLDGKFTQYDHCYHEFDCVEICQEDPNDILNRSISDFLRDAESISFSGWIEFDVLDRALYL